MRKQNRAYLMFFIILCVLISNSILAQVSWSQIGGPTGGAIHDIHSTSNGYIFISTNNGLFRSIDGG